MEQIVGCSRKNVVVYVWQSRYSPVSALLFWISLLCHHPPHNCDATFSRWWNSIEKECEREEMATILLLLFIGLSFALHLRNAIVCAYWLHCRTFVLSTTFCERPIRKIAMFKFLIFVENIIHLMIDCFSDFTNHFCRQSAAYNVSRTILNKTSPLYLSISTVSTTTVSYESLFRGSCASTRKLTNYH